MKVCKSEGLGRTQPNGADPIRIPVRARKSYICSQCGSGINPGEDYIRTSLPRTGPIYCASCKPEPITKLVIKEKCFSTSEKLTTSLLFIPYLIAYFFSSGPLFSNFLGLNAHPIIFHLGFGLGCVLFCLFCIQFVVFWGFLIYPIFEDHDLQWIIDLGKGVIEVQQFFKHMMPPYFKKWKTIPLNKLKDIVYLIIPTYKSRNDQQTYFQFHLQGARSIRIRSDYSHIKWFHNNIEHLGLNSIDTIRNIARFLNIPFRVQVSRARFYVFFVVPSNVIGILGALLFLDYYNSLLYLGCLTVIAFFLALLIWRSRAIDELSRVIDQSVSSKGLDQSIPYLKIPYIGIFTQFTHIEPCHIHGLRAR
ncbi:MAG: hypothetical protein LUQ65_10860 [Candidatus Helarchaeota archaeon]|nr:hypothetical protein [Candidatus Helarchaeota archaeon]